jgi:inorganic phosphate transporter, PiT family
VPGARAASVHWGLARRMAVAWAITLPAAAALGAAASWIAAGGAAGVIAVAVGGVLLGCLVYLLSRRHPVNALNVNDVSVPPPASIAA